MLVATHTHTHTRLLLVLRVTLCRSGDYEQIWCTFNWLCIIIVLLLLLIRIMTLHSPQFIAREWVMQGMWVMQELLLLLSPFPSPSSAIICHHLPSSSSSPSSPSLSSQKCEGDLVFIPKNIAASPPGYIPRSSPCTRSPPPKLCLADNIGCHVPRVKEGGEK